jgi:hypothetical protein
MVALAKEPDGLVGALKCPKRHSFEVQKGDVRIWEDVNGPPFMRRSYLTAQQYSFQNLSELVISYMQARKDKEESAVRLKSIGIPLLNSGTGGIKGNMKKSIVTIAILLFTASAIAQSGQTIKKSQLTPALAVKQVRAMRSQMGDPDSLKVNSVFFVANAAESGPPTYGLCTEFRGRNQMGGFSVYHWFYNESEQGGGNPHVAGSEDDTAWPLVCVPGANTEVVLNVTAQVKAVLKADRAKNDE